MVETFFIFGQMIPFFTYTKQGIYCIPGNFYLDPVRAVDFAIISHGHADHAHSGSKQYLTHIITKEIITSRYRISKSRVQAVKYGEKLNINGVQVSLHPAGHIAGSAQIRLQYKGQIVVYSGDYKTEFDGVNAKYEPIPCHQFITESTFALPIYNWQSDEQIKQQIQHWVMNNQAENKTSILTGYSLGKAQRLTQLVHELGDLYTYSTIHKMNKLLRNQGLPVAKSKEFLPHMVNKLAGKLLIVPPNVLHNEVIQSIPNASVAACSGWMQVPQKRRWQAVDKGFVLSDHADWNGLNWAVNESNAQQVYVTHGYEQEFSRYLNERGIEAQPLNNLLKTKSIME